MNPNLQQKRSIGLLKAFLFFVIFCFYNLATSQTQNGKAVNSYNVCLIVEETQFDEGCMGNGLNDNQQRRAQAYITNNCDQEIIVEAVFTGEFIDYKGNPTTGNSDTEYGIKPGERRRFEFCEAKNGTGTIRVIGVREAGSTSYSSNSTKTNSYSSNSAYNAPSREATRAMTIADINRQRQESQQNNTPRKKTDLELENERKAFHQDHVRKNNESYARRQQSPNQQQQQDDMSSFKEDQLNQIIQDAKQRQKENSDRWQRDHEARIEKNRQDRIALEEAGERATTHMLNGNYIAASTEYATELGRQGNAEAAIGTMVVGAAFQIGSEIAKEKKRKKEEEERKAAERRRQEEERQRRERILERQKRQFNARADQARREKKAIVQSRENFFKEKITHSRTFDVFPQAHEPLYLFLVEASNDYKKYKENISFPSTMDISIKDEASLDFSPIIAVYPNSSGEYPFLKDILSGVEEKFTKRSGTNFIIYNWTRDLEEIKKLYQKVGDKAVAANFIPNFPEELLVDYNEQPSGQNTYWGQTADAKEAASKTREKLNYWKAAETPDTTKKPDTTVIKKSSASGEKIDYWKVAKTPDTTKKSDTTVIKKSSTSRPDYWD